MWWMIFYFWHVVSRMYVNMFRRLDVSKQKKTMHLILQVHYCINQHYYIFVMKVFKVKHVNIFFQIRIEWHENESDNTTMRKINVFFKIKTNTKTVIYPKPDDVI